eukprot:Seg5197.3 transcript_id=Seg5197.3/GoldUCD/mRNA.D3Y31 product="Acid-sensing ion channel 4-A" protein_id=Seg5197.3/GoldUCD/D3Y31
MASKNQQRNEPNSSTITMDENEAKITSTSIVSNYVQSTTIHGISTIYSGRNIFMKLFWLIVFLNVFGLLAWQLYKISERRMGNEVITMVENKAHTSMVFPAVTLCSTRPFRKSVSTNEFFFAKFRSMTSNLTRYGLTINEFLLDETLCSFDQRQCKFKEDFLVTTSWSLGNCFTFKANSSQMQTSLGQKHGFRLAININQNKFTNYEFFASDGRVIDQFPPVGVRVIIHSENEDVKFSADANAILVSPGTMTGIQIRKQNFERLSSPFPDHCIDKENAEEVLGRDIASTTTYSIGLCEFMCKIKKMMDHCKAIHVDEMNQLLLLFPNKTFGYHTPKTSEQIDCIYKDFEKLANITSNCNCRQPCKEQKYKLTVSTAVWPSNDNVDYICSLVNHDRIDLGQNCSKEVIKENVLRLEVYFKDFNVESIKSSPAYGDAQFMSDLGGSLGLWIGASVYSLFELGSLGISLASLLLFRLKNIGKVKTGGTKSSSTAQADAEIEEGRLEPLASRN